MPFRKQNSNEANKQSGKLTFRIFRTTRMFCFGEKKIAQLLRPIQTAYTRAWEFGEYL